MKMRLIVSLLILSMCFVPQMVSATGQLSYEQAEEIAISVANELYENPDGSDPFIMWISDMKLTTKEGDSFTYPNRWQEPVEISLNAGTFYSFYVHNFNGNLVAILRVDVKDGAVYEHENGAWILVKKGKTDGAAKAFPTAATVLVNSKTVAFDAYEINDNNYFKLRDLAYILSGTEKQFEVSWDATANAIVLTSGKAYTPVGGEMANKGTGAKVPTQTDSKITLDGKEIHLTAYQIDGNNYFKLRDIGETFDFGVDWDGAKKTILINTSEKYVAE